MKASKLFLKLKRHMEQYKSKVKCDSNSLDKNDVQRAMSEYNLQNFHEILNLSPEGLDYEVDEEELRDLENRIDKYFSLHSPDDEEFKEFIKLISIYLTFIAKKPLHPPGIKFSDGTTVYQEGNSYYCTGKNLHMKDKNSLCKCCVAQNVIQ